MRSTSGAETLAAIDRDAFPIMLDVRITACRSSATSPSSFEAIRTTSGRKGSPVTTRPFTPLPT
jgi:hypothetical protein